MKKAFFLLLVLAHANSGFSQAAEFSSKWFISMNLKGGKLIDKLGLKSPGLIYADARNMSGTISPDMENDYAYGADIQIGRYFGKKAKFGIATGLLYFSSQGTATLKSLHIEYRSTDFNQDVFRQMITTTKPITEEIKTTSSNIPLLLKFRTMLSRNVGFTMDAGVVYNVSTISTYTADAAFDYEAAYKYDNINGTYTAVYDDGIQPAKNDWLITVEKYKKDKGDGNEVAYFQSFADQGYNVGLDKKIEKTTGTVTHKAGSIGIMLQPMLTFRISDAFSLNVGPYLMSQVVNNTEENNNKMMTNKVGEYNSMLNNAIKRYDNYYGANLGFSLNF